MSASEEAGQAPVIRDRRRIDPVTGQPKEPAGQPRPGKHAASKPGSPRAEAAAPDQAGQAGQGGQAGAAETAAEQGTAAAGETGAAAAAGAAKQGTAAAGAAGAAEQGTAAAGAAEPGTAAAGAARPAGDGQAGTGPEQPADGRADGDLAVRLAERTADLQRIQAEYANYRKRVERDRSAVREQALASVLAELLPVLDDIGRAREHGELAGGFKAIAEALESVVAKLGLTTFGEAGEPFDPNVHEALMHSYSAEVSEPTSVQILQPGYKVGERILRPARVAVAEPTDPAGARTSSGQEAAATAAASGDATASDTDQSADDDS